MRTHKITCKLSKQTLNNLHYNPDVIWTSNFGKVDIYISYYDKPIKYYSIGITEPCIYNDKHILTIASTTLEGKYTFTYQNTTVIITVIRG